MVNRPTQELASDIHCMRVDSNRCVVNPIPDKVDVMGQMIVKDAAANGPIPPAPLVPGEKTLRHQAVRIKLDGACPMNTAIVGLAD